MLSSRRCRVTDVVFARLHGKTEKSDIEEKQIKFRHAFRYLDCFQAFALPSFPMRSHARQQIRLEKTMRGFDFILKTLIPLLDNRRISLEFEWFLMLGDLLAPLPVFCSSHLINIRWIWKHFRRFVVSTYFANKATYRFATYPFTDCQYIRFRCFVANAPTSAILRLLL
jgi:hypothetical protein